MKAKPRKAAPITDKMRLDWLTKQNEHMSLDADLCSKFRLGIGWSLTFQESFYVSPRAALDAAIRAERKGAGK